MTPLGWTIMGASWTLVIGTAAYLVWRSTR